MYCLGYEGDLIGTIDSIYPITMAAILADTARER